MIKFILLFLLVTATSLAQKPADSVVYQRETVLPVFEMNTQDAAKTTKAFIGQIAAQYKGERQQLEMVKFYRDTYGYKIVDKVIIQMLVDSLEAGGLTEEVKSYATDSKHFVKNRFLNERIRDFDFADKNGNVIRLSSLKTKYVVVEIWASWCAPCLVDMPKVPRILESNKQVSFYSISVDRTPEIMAKYVDKYGYQWPIVFGGDKKGNPALWKELHIVAIPKYFIVTDGVIVKVIETFDEEYLVGLK